MVSLHAHFIYMVHYLYDHFHAQTFRIHRWQKLALAFDLLFCLEGIIIFQHEGIDKNFSSSSFVTVYLVNACLRSSLLKSYDLQYLKQMSIASLLFASDLYRVAPVALGLSSFLSRQGQAGFVTALFWQSSLWSGYRCRDRREKQRVPSNGEELDKITNQ